MTVSTLKPFWFDWPEVKRVVDIFAAANIPICFAGGCVRDAIADKIPGDFDIVVGASLPAVCEALEKAGISTTTRPSRFDLAEARIGSFNFDFMYVHGHAPDMPFAEVAAYYVASGDFTINALHLFPSGELHDAWGGKEDVLAGRIRFLNSAHKRVLINSCRIVRFFRFYAWYGKGAPDAESLNACAAYADRLFWIERDAVLSELTTLLSAPSPFAAVALMHRHGVLKHVLGFSIADCTHWESLEQVEALRKQPSAWQVRLATLVLSSTLPPQEALAKLAEFLKLDDYTQEELAAIIESFSSIDTELTVAEQKTLALRIGMDAVCNCLLVRWAMAGDVNTARERYLEALARLRQPLAISSFRPPWLEWPQVKRMLGLLAARGAETCFAGGCIRDAMFGKAHNDFDLLVNLPLPDIVTLFESEAIPYTIVDERWGDVRATIDGIEFELLYVYGKYDRDAARNARRPFQDTVNAYVSYVDFTINSLCLFPSGELQDYFGGQADLKAGKIRFAGYPAAKLKKGVRLAIRFFRFHAWYGRGEPDAAGLKACVERAPDLVSLSRAYVFREMRKLLAAPRARDSLALMHKHDVLKYALGFSIHDCALIDALARVEEMRGDGSSWQVRLIPLLMSAPLSPEKALAHLSEFWKIGDETKEELATLLEYMIVADAEMSAETRKELVARLGKETVRNLLLIRWALEDDVEAAKERYLAAIAAVN